MWVLQLNSDQQAWQQGRWPAEPSPLFSRTSLFPVWLTPEPNWCWVVKRSGRCQSQHHSGLSIILLWPLVTGQVTDFVFILLLLLLFVCFVLFFIYFLLVFETGFLCSFGACPRTSSCRPGWPRTRRDTPASASRVLGLKACATTTRLIF